MSRHLGIAAAAWLLFCTAPAPAAEITLEECLQRAAGRNSGIKAAEQGREAAQRARDGSRSAFFPSLSLKARYTLADEPDRLVVAKDSLTTGLPAQDINLADTRHDTYQAGMFLTQPLFTGGNLTHTLKRATSQARAAEHETNYQRTLLYEQVRRTFYEQLAAGVRVTSLTRAVQSRTRLAEIMAARQAEGYATRQELLRAEADLLETEARLTEARQQAALLLTSLRHLIESPPEEPLQPVGDLQKLLISRPLEEFLQPGAAAREDLQALQSRIRQRDADVGVARSGYYPTVSLQGGYLRQRDTYATRPEIWSVTLQAEWQLFDWGRTTADVQRARALSRQEQFRREEQQKNALNEIELLWRRAQSEQSRLAGLEARLKAAEHGLEQSMAQQQEGRIRLADLYAEEAALWQTFADYSQCAAELHGLAAALERASARPMEHWLERGPLYQPDFERFSARLAAAAIPRPVATPAPVTNLPPSPPEAVVAPSSSVAPPAAQHPPHEYAGAFRLQFGAFARRANAEQLRLQLQTQYPGLRHLELIEDNNLYRVMSGPFATRQAAVEAAHRWGIREYLLKAIHTSHP